VGSVASQLQTRKGSYMCMSSVQVMTVLHAETPLLCTQAPLMCLKRRCEQVLGPWHTHRST